MRILGNKTYVKYDNKKEIERYKGIYLVNFDRRGLCVFGEVVGIGIVEEPVKADYKIGDIIVFQKNAVYQSDLEADFYIRNIDVLAKLKEDKLMPFNDKVVVKQFDGREKKTKSGLVIAWEEEFKNYGEIIEVGGKCISLKKGDKVILDPYSGSLVRHKINMYLLIPEKMVLAKKEE